VKVFQNSRWENTILDYYLSENSVRIKILAWRNLEKLEGFYFIPPKNLRYVHNYIREIGLKKVVLKIISRISETGRNDKFISCGYGKIIETQSVKFHAGDEVLFIAPCHSACVERIVLPENLASHVNQEIKIRSSRDHLHYIKQFPINKNKWWQYYSGWNQFSGITAPPINNNIASEIYKSITSLKNSIEKINIEEPSKIQEHVSITDKSLPPKIPSGCLFGYGNYAKSIILPNISKFINIKHIHEVDPTQIPVHFFKKKDITLDTSPFIRWDKSYDVYFLAGYHHTHAPLAVEALKHQKHVVIEKPIATTWDQLNSLVSVMKSSNGQVFSCFQRRYLIFNELAIKDLELQLGEPVNYHCIVFEVPLPSQHWYRWPNSRSRLLSNGSHWIDHFLYLNDFSKPKYFNVVEFSNDTLNVTIELMNDANFTMTLTDKGSSRIGLQDYCELRKGTITIKIIKGSRYIAESSAKIFRKKKINRLSVYKDMYTIISKNIYNQQPGDNSDQLYISTSTILELEDRLNHLRKN